MAKKRVHEIAKEKGISSKEVLAILQEAGFDVKAAASSVDEDDIARAFGGGSEASQAEAPAATPSDDNGAPPAPPLQPARVPASPTARLRAAPLRATAAVTARARREPRAAARPRVVVEAAGDAWSSTRRRRAAIASRRLPSSRRGAGADGAGGRSGWSPTSRRWRRHAMRRG